MTRDALVHTCRGVFVQLNFSNPGHTDLKRTEQYRRVVALIFFKEEFVAYVLQRELK
jgi:hypothetical protein